MTKPATTAIAPNAATARAAGTKERPILSLRPMVRAILAGTRRRRGEWSKPPKTGHPCSRRSTRRRLLIGTVSSNRDRMLLALEMLQGDHWIRCPYGQPTTGSGCETWAQHGVSAVIEQTAATDLLALECGPSIHMPAGIPHHAGSDRREGRAAAGHQRGGMRLQGIPQSDVSPPDMGVFAYRQLWESINGAEAGTPTRGSGASFKTSNRIATHDHPPVQAHSGRRPAGRECAQVYALASAGSWPATALARVV